MPLLKKKKNKAAMPVKADNAIKSPVNQSITMTQPTTMAQPSQMQQPAQMANPMSMLSPTQTATLASALADVTGTVMANKKPKFSKKKTKV